MADAIRAVATGSDEISALSLQSDYVSRAASCGGAEMTIRYDREHRRAIDDETGEYMEQAEFYYGASTRGYQVHSSDGTEICSAEVKRRDIDTRGDMTVGLVTIDIVSLRSKTDDGVFVSITDPASPAIQKFSRLLEAFVAGPFANHPVIEITATGLEAESGQ